MSKKLIEEEEEKYNYGFVKYYEFGIIFYKNYKYSEGNKTIPTEQIKFKLSILYGFGFKLLRKYLEFI